MLKRWAVMVAGLMMLTVSSAQAARIKDVAKVAGVRSNQLVGYGLVTGLPGTGSPRHLLTKASMPCFKTSASNYHRAPNQRPKTSPR